MSPVQRCSDKIAVESSRVVRIGDTLGVVRTGARAAALERLLLGLGFQTALIKPPGPDLARVPSDQADRIIDVFRSLGGGSDPVRLRPGNWDLAFTGGLVVELDEELHFNRYRRVTLEPEWAKVLPWRDDYIRYSVSFEADCLAAAKWGRRWTNSSCESLFGVAGDPGDFARGGAPRWKQRALYDAMKDHHAITNGDVRLVRLATVDIVGEAVLGDALAGRAKIDLDDLRRLVDGRST